MFDQKLDKAIDLLQVAIIEVEMLKKYDELDKFTTYDIVDKISKNILDCADLIRASDG
jgi:hypothetical protein